MMSIYKGRKKEEYKKMKENRNRLKEIKMMKDGSLLSKVRNRRAIVIVMTSIKLRLWENSYKKR